MSHCVGTHNGQERIAARCQVWQGPAQNIEHCYSFLVCHHPSNTPISLFYIAGSNYYVRANLSQLKCQCFDTRRPPDRVPHPGVQLPGRNPSLRHRQPRRQTQATHRSGRDKENFHLLISSHSQHFCFLKRVTNDLSLCAKFQMEIKRPEDHVDRENCHDFFQGFVSARWETDTPTL